MKDSKTREKFIELRADGLSYDRIAKKLKVNKQTLINWSKDTGILISNLKQIELEALQEKYCLLKRQRIELFGKKLKAIKKELDKRDFTDVPTDKLFELYIKTLKQIETECDKMNFQGTEDVLSASVDRLNEYVSTWSA